MILLTTSHRPTRRVRSLCNDLARSIPGLIRVNRGKMSLIGVAERTVEAGAEKFIIVDRWKGGPGRIRLFKVSEAVFREVPPRLYISGVKLRREFMTPKNMVRKQLTSLFLEAPEAADPNIKKFGAELSDFLGIPTLRPREDGYLGYKACMRVAEGRAAGRTSLSFSYPATLRLGRA